MKAEYILMFVGTPVTLLLMGLATFIVIRLDKPKVKRKP